MTNTGKPYEALTEQVFARLLAQTNLCVRVERDVILQGKAECHQIDVTFEFVAGSTSYRTVVQCKDWASAVKKEQVLAFHSVLNDIPGQPRGIMVSRSGFQEGAREYARHHGIELYELREPHDDDWNGLIRSFEITALLKVPEFRNIRFIWDDERVRQEMTRLGLAKIELSHMIRPGLDVLRFESGATYDLNAAVNRLAPHEVCDWTPIRDTFTQPLLVPIGDGPIPQLPALALEAEVSVRVAHERKFTVSIDHLIAYCFRDVLTGNVRFLDRQGSPLGTDSGT